MIKKKPQPIYIDCGSLGYFFTLVLQTEADKTGTGEAIFNL